MSFSARLLVTSLVTLAVGLGALVVAGNVLLDRRVAAEVSNELRVNAQAQLATLAITSSGVSVREAPNDARAARRRHRPAHRDRPGVGAGAGVAEKDDALRAVVAQSARLTNTVDTLLAVARRELDPTEGAVDLAALAREVEHVDVLEPSGALPLAEGEPDILRRALAPLVANAQRHAHERVTLELSAGEGRVRITVRDDGPGLDPGLGERAFDPGVRGPDERSLGAGLGLPLARRLARSCGGDVVLGDGPGGSFVLELPAVRSVGPR